ncbi:uncharacterized protein EI97DRAFT_434582 [Westerdykella ornata]|uniref:Zn(2)-C6 fungal-type domain-containing protein n=1 Tax=Westerdykella ornata TaxID=318751 RepID=A0A6A6JGB4_WESOR|nr:uncharacterized protein EI97DRAFT_434582 [Westerdykella ornata]KAF2275018.1 hypothetical protein EI97DRAFT_434582 [Westerdykella ornata]
MAIVGTLRAAPRPTPRPVSVNKTVSPRRGRPLDCMSFAPPAAPSKRAIPRLPPHPNSSRYGAMSRQRVPRACYACRTRKIKCNGDHPACQSCREHGMTCSYAPARKDRVKQLTEDNQRLVRLLRGLRSQLGHSRSREIDAILEDATADAIDAPATHGGPGSTHAEFSFVADDERGETYLLAEVGSSYEGAVTDQDSLETAESRATGFMGKTSEIHVVRRLLQLADNPKIDLPTTSYTPPSTADQAIAAPHDAPRSIKSSGNPASTKPANGWDFYMDNETLELDIIVDPSELPPYESAKQLLDCYMKTVHNSFPIVDKLSLYNRFNNYYASPWSQTPKTLSERSLAVLNLVFAIGAVYSHLAEADWRADARDHIIYQSRARALAFKDPWWYPQTDLSQLQLTGLLSFYYLTIGHVNSSWMLSGMAIRAGHAMGLHIRNDDLGVTSVQKETRSRIWWGLHFLETILCTITGRPSAALDYQCSVPLPLPLAADDLEESIVTSLLNERHRHVRKDSLSGVGAKKIAAIRRHSNAWSQGDEPTNCGTYLRNLVTVDMITAAALTDLYSASTVNKSWPTIQKNVTGLLGRLDAWASSITPGLDFMSPKAAVNDEWRQERMVLAYNYYSTKILITRPCLCRIDRHVPSQSQDSDEFNMRMSEECVEAAASIASLLPDGADQIGIRAYYVTPWWSMVHFLMQAITTLLLDIFSVTIQISPERPEKLTCVKKILGGLRAMACANALAGRAYHVAFNILQKLAARADNPVDLSDLQPSHNAYYARSQSHSPFSHPSTANPGTANRGITTNPSATAFSSMPTHMHFDTQPGDPAMYTNPQHLAADFDLATWAQSAAPGGAGVPYAGLLNAFPGVPGNGFANLHSSPAGPRLGASGGATAAGVGFEAPAPAMGGMYMASGLGPDFQFWGQQSQG